MKFYKIVTKFWKKKIIRITYFQYYAFDDTIERVVDLVQNETNDLLNILIEPLTRFSKVSFYNTCLIVRKIRQIFFEIIFRIMKINEKRQKYPLTLARLYEQGRTEKIQDCDVLGNCHREWF